MVATNNFRFLSYQKRNNEVSNTVSRSSYSFADERDENITRYCRLTFPACDCVKI